MADVSYSVNVNINAGALQQNINAPNLTSDFQTAGLLAVSLTVGTATQAVSTASASVLGLAVARCLATAGTHTVSFGRLEGTTFLPTARLKVGDAAVMRLAAGDYAVQSNAPGSRFLVQILGE
jgi:hypothetical protein